MSDYDNKNRYLVTYAFNATEAEIKTIDEFIEVNNLEIVDNQDAFNELLDGIDELSLDEDEEAEFIQDYLIKNGKGIISTDDIKLIIEGQIEYLVSVGLAFRKEGLKYLSGGWLDHEQY